jgi:hypothetical protein
VVIDGKRTALLRINDAIVAILMENLYQSKTGVALIDIIDTS